MKKKIETAILSILAIGIVISIIQISLGLANIYNLIKYEFSSKKDLKISISNMNPLVKSLSADPDNSLFMKIIVRDNTGVPVPKAKVNISISSSSNTEKDIGKISEIKFRTDQGGQYIISYKPPQYNKGIFDKDNSIYINATISGSNISSKQEISLVKPPVILVHGYQAYPFVMENMSDYLISKGFSCSSLEYKSENGVVEGSKSLNKFIQEQKLIYLEKGIQVNKFDIIAHSMGGLVARYYTCSDDYINNSDVRKIIFVSVPQKGCPWAPLAESYFNDVAIKDLMPDSVLLTKTLPGMLNKGLNSKIQIGSILGQYDEVVSQESASLDEWNIKTELFQIGGNSINFDNILKGNFNESTNHMNILSNKKVFKKVENMLHDNLPYPSIKK